jgi:hypothetical protein
MNIEWSTEATNLLDETVEFDLVRYDLKDDREMYKNLLSLHYGKFNHWISKGRYKDQNDFIDDLTKYRNTFKSFAEPQMVFY